MISRVKVLNFKSLRCINVETRRLTLLYGLNGSGKSSFLQTLLFTGRNVTRDVDGAVLNDSVLRIGRQRDVFYCYNAMRGATMSIVLQGIPTSEISSHYQLTDFDSDRILLEGRSYKGEAQGLIDALKSMQYISASRPEPSALQTYKHSSIDMRDWGRQGENAVAFLLEKGDEVFVDPLMLHDENIAEAHQSLRVQVNAWLSEIAPGAAMALSRKPGNDNVDVRIRFSSGANAYEFRPENVGFGISIVLPLIVMILTAKKGDVLLIENPEAHLHPGGQVKLGELISRASAAGVQLFVETHSDHVINGVRVAIKNGVVKPGDANVLYFERKFPDVLDNSGVVEQWSECKEIHLDKHGEFDDYPEGFLDEWNKQVIKLWK